MAFLFFKVCIAVVHRGSALKSIIFKANAFFVFYIYLIRGFKSIVANSRERVFF